MPLMVLTPCFDLVGDLGLDLLRRGARLHGRDDDGRDVDLGNRSTPSFVNEIGADDGQRQDEDGREDRTFDTERSEPLHKSTRDLRQGSEVQF